MQKNVKSRLIKEILRKKKEEDDLYKMNTFIFNPILYVFLLRIIKQNE